METLPATETIRVVTTARTGYELRLAVAGRSLIEHLGPRESLVFTVIEDGLAEDTRERLLHSWGFGEPRQVEVGARRWSDPARVAVDFVAFEPAAATWARAPGVPDVYFARLDASRYLPAGCERAIFLDADVLVRTDIGRLWRLPLGDRIALATRDPFVGTLGHPNGVAGWRELRLDGEAPYLSAAVMVIDLRGWQREGVTERAAAYLERFGAALRFGEQDVVNASLYGHWGELDPRWQVQPRFLARRRLSRRLDAATRALLRDDPWIYHFGGRLKPWKYRGRTVADREFFACLDRTAWRGWRPPRTPSAALLGLYDSPARDWLHPLEVAWSRWRRQSRHLAPRPRGAREIT